MGERGPVLAIDPGSRRIGVALSDPGGTVALPLTVISVDGGHLDRLADLARERGVCRVIVGLPLGMDGSEGPSARRARELTAELRKVMQVPVELVDERLTTVAANRAMAEAGVRSRGRRPVVDKVAAALLLQSYLDGHRG